MLMLKLIEESFRFAWNSLFVNKLRTLLSLLGVSIGIFAIVSVYTMVDSLERSIQQSISTLGDNVVFIDKWPWTFQPDYPHWKYEKRPLPSYEDFRHIQRYSKVSDAVVFKINGNKTVSFENNSVERTMVAGVSYQYDMVHSLEVEKGRYFTQQEASKGSRIAILGAGLAKNLFGEKDPVGHSVKLLGQRVLVIGILKKEGESTLGPSLDDQMIIPIQYARTIFDEKNESTHPLVMVRAAQGISNLRLMEELTRVMRSKHRLSPKEEDDFSLNETSLLAQAMGQLLMVITLAGLIIGGFSVVVGGFSISNIMFVSVKERTGLIGVQKAMGAKRAFILWQFLFESIFLCLFGGVLGLIFIVIATVVVNMLIDFEVFLGIGNVIFGLVFSVIIGVLSGIIPSWHAARLDPVEAMRRG